MAGRTSRYFGDLDKKQLMKELATWRDVCVQVCIKAPINGDIYRLATKLMGDIDTAVETLTGDRQYFHTKPHSTGGK